MQNIGYFSHKYHILSKNTVEFALIKVSTRSIQRWLNGDCEKVDMIDIRRFEKYEKNAVFSLSTDRWHFGTRAFPLWLSIVIGMIWIIDLKGVKNQCKCTQISTVVSDGYLFQWFICDFYMTNRHIPTVSEQFFGAQNIGNFINNYYVPSSNTAKMALLYAFTNANEKWFYGFFAKIYTNDNRFEIFEKTVLTISIDRSNFGTKAVAMWFPAVFGMFWIIDFKCVKNQCKWHLFPNLTNKRETLKGEKGTTDCNRWRYKEYTVWRRWYRRAYWCGLAVSLDGDANWLCFSILQALDR